MAMTAKRGPKIGFRGIKTTVIPGLWKLLMLLALFVIGRGADDGAKVEPKICARFKLNLRKAKGSKYDWYRRPVHAFKRGEQIYFKFPKKGAKFTFHIRKIEKTNYGIKLKIVRIANKRLTACNRYITLDDQGKNFLRFCMTNSKLICREKAKYKVKCFGVTTESIDISQDVKDKVSNVMPIKDVLRLYKNEWEGKPAAFEDLEKYAFDKLYATIEENSQQAGLDHDEEKNIDTAVIFNNAMAGWDNMKMTPFMLDIREDSGWKFGYNTKKIDWFPRNENRFFRINSNPQELIMNFNTDVGNKNQIVTKKLKNRNTWKYGNEIERTLITGRKGMKKWLILDEEGYRFHRFCKSVAGIEQQRLDIGKAMEDAFTKKVAEVVQNVKPDLFKRSWEYTEGESRDAKTIRVCQFNILAHGLSSPSSGFAYTYNTEAPKDALTEDKVHMDHFRPAAERELLFGINSNEDEKTAGHFGYSEKDYDYENNKFKIPHRLKRILGVILAQRPEIITLQELDHFDTFQQILEPLNYTGDIHYKPNDPSIADRKGISPSVNYNGGNGPDGTAIFWDNKRFVKPKVEKLVLQKAKMKNGKREASKQKVLRVILTDTMTNKKISVITGHFKSGSQEKDRPDQDHHVEQLLGWLSKDVDEGRQIIFACDFNKNVNSEVFEHFWKGQKKRKVNFESAYDINGLKVGDTVEILKDKIDWNKVTDRQGEKGREYIRPEHYRIDGKIVQLTFPDGRARINARGAAKHPVLSEDIEVQLFAKNGADDYLGNVVNTKNNYVINQMFLEPIMLAKVEKIDRENGTVTVDKKRWGKKGVLSIFKVRNRTRLSCVKWRRGGTQKEKILQTKETIDFIFSRGLKCIGTLALPTVDDVEKKTEGLGLPCWQYPSDHFMMAADLKVDEKWEAAPIRVVGNDDDDHKSMDGEN